MKPLPLTLRKNGFNYTQLLRGVKTYIYEQEVLKDLKYYEVFQIKIAPERIFKGKVIEPHERFPHDEAFGVWAWTYRNYESALKKFEELEKEII